MSAVEIEMGSAVEEARTHLLSYLTAEERSTVRSPGSDYPRTFEDSARRIVLDDDDPRAWVVGIALANYQAAVNALWEWAVKGGIVAALARNWIHRRRPQLDSIGAAYRDVFLEATWAARRAVSFYGPGKNRFAVYAYKPIFQGLDLWFFRQLAPVEMPEKVAMTKDAPRRARLEVYTDLFDEEEL